MGKYSAEKILTKILTLEPVEFIGICKIIGVDISKKTEEQKEEVESRDFYEIWCDVCDTISKMNRTRRKNLGKLVYAATKKEKEKEE